MPSEHQESEVRPPRPQGSARPKVTVAVPDLALRGRISRLLRRTDVEVESLDDAHSLAEALEGRADVVVVRRSQLSARAGELAEAGELDHPAIIVLDEGDDPVDRARLVAAGATGVLDVDAPDAELGDAIQDLAAAELAGGWARPDGAGRGSAPRLSDFRSRSPRMQRFLDVIDRIKDSDASLLITGPTGVGKERLARAIHAESPRAAGPFVSVNCGALPENLLESELFGHERGAFTGAERKKPGRFELAEGGTIFLDEIGEMPKHLQVNLLTVLQRREVRRLGADRTVPIDVRVMAATHRDLRAAVAEGSFREDLFFRLHVVPLEIPSLADRVEDLPQLIGTFVRHLRGPLGRAWVRGFRDEALAAMLAHDWPGNVRELQNVIERALLLCRGAWISSAELTDEVRTAARSDPAAAGPRPASAAPAGLAEALLALPIRDAREQVLADFERRYLAELLRATQGRINTTAARAGLHVRSLHDKLKKHGLRKEDFRPR